MLSIIIILGLTYLFFKFFFILLDVELTDNIKNKYNFIDTKLNNFIDWVNNLLSFNFTMPKFKLNLNPIKNMIKRYKSYKRYDLIDCSNVKSTKKLKVTKTINPNNIITDYIETDHNGFETKWQVVETTDPRLNIQSETVVVQEFEETTETNSVSFA
jgi:hypothetical protein